MICCNVPEAHAPHRDLWPSAVPQPRPAKGRRNLDLVEFTSEIVQLLRPKRQLQAAARFLSAKRRFQSISCTCLTVCCQHRRDINVTRACTIWHPDQSPTTWQDSHEGHTNSTEVTLRANPSQAHGTCQCVCQGTPAAACPRPPGAAAAALSEAVAHPRRCLPGPPDEDRHRAGRPS